jgi:hypothetical protein
LKPTEDKKILLEDFNAKAGRLDIFKPALGNKSLHETSNNNNRVTTVNSATLKSNYQEHNVPT